MTGLLIATIGVPGAGKTTWRTAVAGELGAVVVSLDEYRAAVSCCAADQAATPAAVEQATRAARAVLADGGTVLWDATNAQRRARYALLELAAGAGALAVGVLFAPPLAVALERNARRCRVPCRRCGHSRRVPHAVITRMYRDLTRDEPGLPGEGWHHLHRHTLDLPRKETVR